MSVSADLLQPTLVTLTELPVQRYLKLRSVFET